MPDAGSVLVDKLTSPAAACFTGLRNYPAARGEADGASASIRASLQRVQAVTKEIAMRIIKSKVCSSLGRCFDLRLRHVALSIQLDHLVGLQHQLAEHRELLLLHSSKS